MSEPTLTLCYVELMDEVAHFLYGKVGYDNLTGDQRQQCDNVVQAGYRQFLYPPAARKFGMSDNDIGYEWSFMRPVTYLTTTADDEDQDMPEDFGRLIGDGFTWGTGVNEPHILADVGEGRIRKLRATCDQSGRPTIAGLRRKVREDASTQHLWEVMWYPTPDDAYTLYYRYEALVDALTEDTNFILGGLKYAETIKASCVAAADARVNDNRQGAAFEDFIGLLLASIKRDRNEGRKFFGYVGTKDEYGSTNYVNRTDYTITINGTQTYPE